MPIETIEDLRQHLELAITIELSTVPPYLYAQYSIEDQTSESALLIRSIVVEEMLHAALATNLLLAVGGSPDFKSTRYMPTYPMELPHHRPPLTLDLAHASDRLIEDVLMRVEQPELYGAPAEPDEYETLGQFYHALEIGVEAIAEQMEVFGEPQLERQMTDPSWYAPVAFSAADSGGLVMVNGLASAVEAIEIIIHQGEGMSDERWADPGHQELTHYYKLLGIHDGSVRLGAVRELPTNPRTSAYSPEMQVVSNLFNACYRGVYLIMNRIFEGGPDRAEVVGLLYVIMTQVMSQVAQFMTKRDVGPTFEVYEFKTESAREEILELSEAASHIHPDLEAIHETIQGIPALI